MKMIEIAQERLILYNKGSLTFQLIEQFFRHHKLTLQNYIELGSMEAIKELIKINYGLSFVASWIVEGEINQGSITHIPTGCRRITREWGICYANEKKLSITEETFLGICELITGNMPEFNRSKTQAAAKV